MHFCRLSKSSYAIATNITLACISALAFASSSSFTTEIYPCWLAITRAVAPCWRSNKHDNFQSVVSNSGLKQTPNLFEYKGKYLWHPYTRIWASAYVYVRLVNDIAAMAACWISLQPVNLKTDDNNCAMKTHQEILPWPPTYFIKKKTMLYAYSTRTDHSSLQSNHCSVQESYRHVHV